MTWATGNQNIPINLKKKVFNACILAVMTYGIKTFTLTVRSTNRITYKTTKLGEKSRSTMLLHELLPDREQEIILKECGLTTKAIDRRYKNKGGKHMASVETEPI